MYGVYVYRQTEEGTKGLYHVITSDSEKVISLIKWFETMSSYYSDIRMNVITEGKVTYHY